MNQSINQFLAGLLTLLITLITAAVAIPAEAWALPLTIWQFAGLVVSTILVIFLPLAKGGWAAAIKVIGSLAAAAIANVVGVLITGDPWAVAQWLLLGLAILNALAAELGVNVRISGLKQIIVSPTASTAAATASDPAGVAVAEAQLEHTASVDGKPSP